MQFELRANGKVEVELIPETEIENAFVRAFLGAAEKGVVVNVTPTYRATGEPAGMTVAIQK